MSHDIEGANRGLKDTVEDFFSIAQAIRARHRSPMAAAIASDDLTKIDGVLSQMNEEANDLLQCLAEIEGLEVAVEFAFDGEVDLDDDLKIILVVQGGPIELAPHA